MVIGIFGLIQFSPNFDLRERSDVKNDFRHKNKSGNHEKTEYKNSTERTPESFSKQKTIVLFTYYRSGSTFTGQLLNQHPGMAFTKVIYYRE